MCCLVHVQICFLVVLCHFEHQWTLSLIWFKAVVTKLSGWLYFWTLDNFLFGLFQMLGLFTRRDCDSHTVTSVTGENICLKYASFTWIIYKLRDKVLYIVAQFMSKLKFRLLHNSNCNTTNDCSHTVFLIYKLKIYIYKPTILFHLFHPGQT